MASAINGSGAAAASNSKANVQAKFDQGIALTLANWPALTLAVQENWGGPDSLEKRDWFAGAVSDLFVSNADDIDSQYLEEFLLQVMQDEFEVNVEDDSGEEVADQLILLRKETQEGYFATVDSMFATWEEKRRRGGDKIAARFVAAQDDGAAHSSGDDGSDDDDMDVDMEDGSQSASASQPRERPPPEVDEDGFTKVVTKKKR